MPRKHRKQSDLAALRQQRAANAKHSAIVNPRLIVKVAAIVRDIYTQRTRPIDDRRDKCAVFTAADVPANCPTFGVGNSQYAIQPR